MIRDYKKQQPTKHKPISVREVRMWHWQRVLNYQAVARKHYAAATALEAEGKSAKAVRNLHSLGKQSDNRADFHLRAVYALNEVPSLQGTTAEEDYGVYGRYVANAD